MRSKIFYTNERQNGSGDLLELSGSQMFCWKPNVFARFMNNSAPQNDDLKQKIKFFVIFNVSGMHTGTTLTRIILVTKYLRNIPVLLRYFLIFYEVGFVALYCVNYYY